jgi:hypothetical protein
MHIYSKYIRSEFDYDQPVCCMFGLAAIPLGHVASSSSLVRHSTACSDCTASDSLLPMFSNYCSQKTKVYM